MRKTVERQIELKPPSDLSLRSYCAAWHLALKQEGDSEEPFKRKETITVHPLNEVIARSIADHFNRHEGNYIKVKINSVQLCFNEWSLRVKSHNNDITVWSAGI